MGEPTGGRRWSSRSIRRAGSGEPDPESRIRAGRPPRPLKRAADRVLAARPGADLTSRRSPDTDPAEEVFDAAAFTHNRSRPDEHGPAAGLPGPVGDARFGVDGTPIESRASIKSLRPIGEGSGDERPEDADGGKPGGGGFETRDPPVDFRGRKRSGDTHRGATDPEARPCRKAAGRGAKPARPGRSLCENRHGPIVAVEVAEADGTAERDAAPAMLDRVRTGDARGPRRGGGRRGLRQRAARDQPAGEEEGGGAVRPDGGDRRAGPRPVRGRFVGRWKLKQQMETAAAAFNLIRPRKLLPA